MNKRYNSKRDFEDRIRFFGLFILMDLFFTFLMLLGGHDLLSILLKIVIFSLVVYWFHRRWVFVDTRKRVRDRWGYLNTMERISRILISGLNLQQIFWELIDELAILINFENGTIYVLDEQGDQYRAYSCETDIDELDSTIGELGKPYYSNKGSKIEETILTGWQRIFFDEGLWRIQIPIIYQEKMIGVFELTRSEDVFDQEDYLLLSPIIERLSIAIQNCLIYQKTKELSLKDYLTNTSNRRALDQHLEQQHRQANQHDQPFSILIVDIDYFKKINDTYGHLAGDDVLRELAGIMKNEVRTVDHVFRFGGEEFVIILPETSRQLAFAVAERLRNKIAEYDFFSGSLQIKITVSIGVATYSKETDNIRELFKGADIKLYAAKHCGRNQVVQLA